MKLYVIRHGESETNEAGCYTGWKQVSLTKKGFEDAKGVQPFLRNIRFDKIYSSDLIRAKNTAETALPGCVYEETPLLREIDVGILSGKNILKCHEEYGETIAKSSAEVDYSAFGGETRAAFFMRVRTFLDSVSNSGHETVAAFSHVGVLRAMLDIVAEMSVPRNKILCHNCTLAIFEYSNNLWHLHSWINTK